MGSTRREYTRYHEGAKPEDGRGFQPAYARAPLCDPRAREGRKLGSDLGLTELLE
jgi:hypothetical protein